MAGISLEILIEREVRAHPLAVALGHVRDTAFLVLRSSPNIRYAVSTRKKESNRLVKWDSVTMRVCL